MSQSLPPELPAEQASGESSDVQNSVILVPYPKIIFLYPTLIACLVAGGIMLNVDAHGTTSHIVSTVVLGVLAINMVVFSFDFPRTTSLTLFFAVASIVLGLVLWFKFQPEAIPAITAVLSHFAPEANATFYFSIAGVLAVLYGIMLITTRLDYWEVRPNELLHHHGVLSDLKRYSAPNLKIEKEINDLFEYLLLGSGRLILKPRDEPRAIILDNVLFIAHKERALTKLLGALQVQVRDTR